MESCEVPFTVLAQTGAITPRPCQVYQEIHFSTPVLVDHIKFRNFYCASLSIMQLLVSPETNDDKSQPEWIPILISYQLMENPHFEDDAQYFHTILSSQFNQNFVATVPIVALRLCLEQPSPNWSSFGLRNLRCFTLRTLKHEPVGEIDSDKTIYDAEKVARVQDAVTSIVEIRQILSELRDCLH